MRMCMAFLDHNKRWSMPCRVYHRNRLENRQVGNCRQTKGAVCSQSHNRHQQSQEKELILLRSVSRTIHYPQREPATHKYTHSQQIYLLLYILPTSDELSSVCN